MKRTIFFFVKVFDRKDYAESMLDGKLYMNRLSYFRKMEEIDAVNRADKHEAVVGWLQPQQARLTLNGHEFDPATMSGPISLQMNRHNNLNVYCLYAAHSGEYENFTVEEYPLFKKQLEISEECKNLGEYAVVITSAKEFIHRITESVKKCGYGMGAGLVDYYDPEQFSGFFDEDKAAFQKRIEYQHQREYRFSLDTGLDGENAIHLDIGDIRDIAHICNVEDINKGLEIRHRELENA